MGLGLALVVDAVAELEEIDVAFSTSFSTVYENQKSYVFETAEGERVNVRAADYNHFKKQLKTRYDQRFGPEITVPTS